MTEERMRNRPNLPGPESAKPRILLVDDNPTNLQVLAQTLEGIGVDLLIALNGEEALQIAAAALPAVILLDINMPGIGGFETCRRLKADPVTRKAIVVFLTARGDVTDKVKGFELGAADYISKPFEIEEVEARVKAHLEAYEREQTLAARARELEVLTGQRMHDPEPEELAAMIRAGESDRFELKSTLRMNLKSGKHGKEIENAWLKTVVAFLNSEGGLLLVGVQDDGSTLGIEPDGFDNEDRYLLHVNNLIRNHIGVEFAPFVRFGLKPLEDKQVLCLQCLPAQSSAFLKRDGVEEFYIRVGPGSRKLTTSEVINYIQSRGGPPLPKTLVPPRPTSGPAVEKEAKQMDAPEYVLLVDDNTDNLQVLSQTLDGQGLELLVARSGAEALEVAREAQPVLILLDIMMPPGIDGYETCQRLKRDPATQDASVIFLSALDDTEAKVRGFEVGGVDYISKPFQAREVIARVQTHMTLQRLKRNLALANKELRDMNLNLEKKVAERSAELLRSRDAVLFGLATLAESRDGETGRHLERICAYVEILGREFARRNPDVDEQWIRNLVMTSTLHDVGKVSTPDAVLLKPGRLNDEERSIMERHPAAGGNTLLAVKERWGESPFLTMAAEIALGHHEKWDGTGYPTGTAGKNTPLAARIVALADVYDALTVRRVYKPPMSHEEASQIIFESAGRHLDPEVVEVFRVVGDEFRAIAEQNKE